MTNVEHKIITHDSGATLWGECACGWIWLGEYEMPSGRRKKMQADHERSIERASWAARLDAGEPA